MIIRNNLHDKLLVYISVAVIAIAAILLVLNFPKEEPQPLPPEEPPAVEEPVVEAPTVTVEPVLFCDEIPMSAEEQESLFSACDEFGIAPSVLLGLIDYETDFRNIVGDDGKSYGYCQVQPRWWKDLMGEIGAEDLLVPQDCFRTSCAVLCHYAEVYGCGNLLEVLTAYNAGRYSGTITEYAYGVAADIEHWEAILEEAGL